MPKRRWAAVALALSLITAQRCVAVEADAATRASSAFCLFELPPDADKRTWVNLGIVQYVELHATELRLYFGGGNLGSGHEFRLPIAGQDEGLAFMARMRAAAASCATLVLPAERVPAPAKLLPDMPRG